MKITQVEAIYLRLPVVTAACDGTQDNLLVLVHTDEGITGVGEVDSAPLVAKACIESPLSHQICNGLANLLVGENPLDIHRLWNKMYEGTHFFGRFGPTIHAMSGIDLALWDIAGKHAGLPVYRLLGGAFQSKLRAYASILFGDTPEQTGAIARKWAGEGFTAIKFGWGPFGKSEPADRAHAQAAREGMGKDRDFMIDVGCTWDWKTAVRREEMLRQFNPFWIEEPLHPDDFAGYGELSKRSPTRIAAGEGESGVPAFEALLRQGGIDIVQPDMARCGGLTTAMKIAETARTLGRGVCNHAYKTGISIAASLHFLAAIPNAVVLEYTVSSSALRHELTKEKFPLVNGYVEVPQTPGLGVELNWDAVEKYRQG